VKLPLERKPFSGSFSSWISDANGNDIARVSGGLKTSVVAFEDKDAEQLVFAVNNQDAWLTQIREYERIMKESGERHEEVLSTCRELRRKLVPIHVLAISLADVLAELDATHDLAVWSDSCGHFTEEVKKALGSDWLNEAKSRAEQ